VRLRIRVIADIRNAVATRLATRRVPRPKTLSPLIRLSGQSPSQDAKWDSVFQRVISSPTSLTIVWATMTSMPSMRVRSTPVIRCSSRLRSKRGAFFAAFAFFRLGFAGDGAGATLSAN
jgi:hypothetical protein